MAIHWGKLIVGLATGYISITSLREAFARSDAALKRLEQQCPGNDPKCKIVPAGNNIETRAQYIAQMAWTSSLDPEIKRLAMLTLNKKCSGEWCTPPRDKMAEINALADAVGTPRSELWREMRALEGHFAWIKENIAYRSDHFAVDSFPSAKRTIGYKGEDCDGHTVLFDALAMATGFKTGMRIYQTKNATEWDHISAIAEVPPHSGKWMVFDPSVDDIVENGKKKKVYPSWQAPSRIVKRYVDFAILPGGKVRKIGSGP
jgi:hypothetical protein